MKNIGILLTLFVLLTLAVCFVPAITNYDILIIKAVQHALHDLPVAIPEMAGKAAYSIMIAVPLVVGSGYFLYKKMYKNAAILCSVPLFAYCLNTIIKDVIHRARPPYYLQIAYHPHSFSYVSRHTFVTACLWGMVIYFTQKYIENPLLKNFIITFSGIWIVFSGFSRIWLGVHYPSDVFGAYILASVVLVLYIKFSATRS